MLAQQNEGLRRFHKPTVTIGVKVGKLLRKIERTISNFSVYKIL